MRQKRSSYISAIVAWLASNRRYLRRTAPSPVREAAASPHLMQASNFVRIGSRTVLQHLDVAHQFFVGSTPDNGHWGCRLQLDGRDRIREAMEARRAATQCGSRQRGSMDVPAPITSANAKTATASGTHPEKTQSAPRTVNALLDLLQFLGPSSARFQAVIHSLSVRFMPKSSLRCLSKSGMWAAP